MFQILLMSLVVAFPILSAQRQCITDDWTITYDRGNHEEGEVILLVALSQAILKIPGDYVAQLLCTDLLIDRNGKIPFTMHKSAFTVRIPFNLSLPDPQNEEAYFLEDEWISHNCSLQVSTRHSSRLPANCEFKIKSFLGRILPFCDNIEGSNVLERYQTMEKEGNLLLFFANSPNDIVTYDSYCISDDTGIQDQHDIEEEKKENMLPLTPAGEQPTIVSVDFSPDCDNPLVNKMFQNHHLSKCYIEVFALCQEGDVKIQRITPEFDKSALTCDAPKPGLVVVGEKLELQFMIASIPVVLLLALLILQTTIVLILIFTLVIKMICIKLKKIYTEKFKKGKLQRRKKEKEEECLLTEGKEVTANKQKKRTRRHHQQQPEHNNNDNTNNNNNNRPKKKDVSRKRQPPEQQTTTSTKKKEKVKEVVGVEIDVDINSSIPMQPTVSTVRAEMNLQRTKPSPPPKQKVPPSRPKPPCPLSLSSNVPPPPPPPPLPKSVQSSAPLKPAGPVPKFGNSSTRHPPPVTSRKPPAAAFKRVPPPPPNLLPPPPPPPPPPLPRR